MSRELHDQARGCLHVEERPEMAEAKARREIAQRLLGAGGKRRKRRVRKESCRSMKLAGTVVRVRGRHPMPKRSVEALDALVRAVLVGARG